MRDETARVSGALMDRIINDELGFPLLPVRYTRALAGRFSCGHPSCA